MIFFMLILFKDFFFFPKEKKRNRLRLQAYG